MLAKDEYLGNGDGIEPSLDPTPYSGKERRGTNDLSWLALKGMHCRRTYKYSVKCLWVMCRRQYTSILHMRFQIPELRQADA